MVQTDLSSQILVDFLVNLAIIEEKINLVQPENFFYTDLVLACLIVTNTPNFLRAKISLDKLVYEQCL